MATIKAGATLTSYDNWMKDWYKTQKNLEKLLYPSSMLWSELVKRRATSVIGGKQVVVPVQVGDNPNASKQFRIAQRQSQEASFDKAHWTVDVDADFAVATIQNSLIYSSKNDRGAFVRSLKKEMDSALKGLRRKRATDIYIGGDNSRGQVKTAVAEAAGAAGKQFVLKNKSDAIHWDIGYKIEFHSALTGAASTTQREHTTSEDKVFTITKVKRSDGTITVNEALPALSADDYCFREGDRGEKTMDGLSKWLPVAGVGTSAFHNIDRSKAPERLGGIIRSSSDIASTAKYDTQLRKAAADCYSLVGKTPDMIWCHPLRYNDIITELGDKIRYQRPQQMSGKDGAFGFDQIGVWTAGGFIPIKADVYCPEHMVYGLSMDDIGLWYIADDGKEPVDFINNPAGGLIQHSADEAALEIRCESYMALIVQNPGCHFACDFTNVSIA